MVVVLIASSAIGTAAAGDLVIVSQTSGGTTANGSSNERSMSNDGRYVAFISNASNLGVTNSLPQAFVRDTVSGTTTLASVGSDGTSLANAAVDQVTVSDDGQRVAFHTRATNIVAGASTGGIDRSYVRDVGLGTTMEVDGASDDDAVDPYISGDGTEVAFASHGGYDGLSNVSINTYERSVGSGTLGAIHGVSSDMTDGRQPALSESGRFVAMRGQKAGISGQQVFLRDMTASSTTLISRATGAAGAASSSSGSDEAAVSSDGRYVVFRSQGENLSADDDPAHSNADVYERDTQDNTTTLVSRADGASGAFVPFPDDSSTPSVSDDGRRVAFISSADNLASVQPTGTGGQNEYLRDVVAGTTTLISAKDDGSAPPPGEIDGSTISGNGLFVAFSSNASLKTGTSGLQVYRRELASLTPPPTPPVVSIGDAGTVTEGGPGQVTQATFSVTLDKSWAQPVTVDWQTDDGTATSASGDYHAHSGQVVFDPGQTSATVSVDVVGDSQFESDETFDVSLHNPVNATLGSHATGAATIANDDAQAATPAPGPGPTPPVSPSGLGATSGAPVADCATQIQRGQAQLTGCFSGDTAHGKVAINGLLVKPDSSATSITATPARISSSGPVTVTAGDVAISHGNLDLDPTAKGVAGVLTPANGNSLYGLELGPQLALTWASNAAVVVKGGVSPHFGTVSGTPLQATIPADAANGLHRDQLTAGAPASLVGPIITTDLSFKFVPAEQRWTGSITLESPVFAALKISAALGMNTGLITGGGALGNRVIHGFVKMRRFDVQLLMNPLRIEGTMDAVGGPFDLFGFDGTFKDDLSSGAVTVAGDARIYGIPLQIPKTTLGGGSVDGFNTGGVGGLANQFTTSFDGNFTTQVTDANSNPIVQVAPFNFGGIAGLIGGIGGIFAFNGEGSGQATVLGVQFSNRFVFSENGWGACGQAGPFNVGFGVVWHPFAIKPMGPFVCDVGAFKSAASAAQATGTPTVRLGKGKQMLRLVGDTAPPQVTLTGAGHAVTVPAADQQPLVSKDAIVLRDSSAKTTYIGVADGGGATWTIARQPGSARIVSVSTAQLLPKPRVTARVSGRGARRALHWKATTAVGQQVVFAERAGRATVPLKRVGGSHGTIRFAPIPAGGRHTITATVLEGNSPRATLTVARFKGPRSGRRGVVRRLAVALKGRKVALRWSGVAGAAHYVVELRTASGTVVRMVGARRHALAMTALVRVRSAAVTVIAVDAFGRRGPARKVARRAR